MSKSYLCTIQIDAEGDNPLEAAAEAERMLRDPECLGWVVHCQTDGERPMLIDNAGELEAKLAPPLVPDMSDREVATVLAALRWWQHQLAESECTSSDEAEEMPASCDDLAWCYEIARDAGDRLRIPEINALCERLNVFPDTYQKLTRKV